MTKLHHGVTQDVFDMWVDRVATRIDADILDRIEPQLNDIGWYKERTCQMTDGQWDNGQCTWGTVCSECDAHLEHERGRHLNYCPNCGARVRSEA